MIREQSKKMDNPKGNRTIKIKGLDLEFTLYDLFDEQSGRIYFDYTDVLGMLKDLDGDWRLPTLKEFELLYTLKELGVGGIDDEEVYWTADKDQEYMPLNQRENNPVIQKKLEEDPFCYDDRGIDQVWTFDMGEGQGMMQCDTERYRVKLVRTI